MGFHSSKNYVNGLSAKELGNALYHIANHTNVSKGYTQEFIRNVLLRASEIVYLSETRPAHTHVERFSEEVLRALDEAIIHDWTPPEHDDVDDGIHRTEYEKFMIRQSRGANAFKSKDAVARVGIEEDAPVPDFTHNWIRNKWKPSE